MSPIPRTPNFNVEKCVGSDFTERDFYFVHPSALHHNILFNQLQEPSSPAWAQTSKKGVIAKKENPLFSDTYKRSRRDTAGKRLVRSVRFFLVFNNSGISPKNLGQNLKNNSPLATPGRRTPKNLGQNLKNDSPLATPGPRTLK